MVQSKFHVKGTMSESTESANEFTLALGRQVRMYRQLAEMTQDDLCERCGIFRTYLSRIENGIANPTVTVLWALAGALKVQPWDLLCEGPPVDTGFASRVHKGRKH